MRFFKQVQTFVIVGLLASIASLCGQAPGTGVASNIGQAKAELIKSAFSSYLAGDTIQARQYLIQASQLDVEDVTVRRLLESLTPAVAAPVPTPAPAPAPVVAPVPGPAPAAPPMSASDRARAIALNNGLTPAEINAALQSPPAPVPTPPVAAPALAPVPSPLPPVAAPTPSLDIPDVALPPATNFPPAPAPSPTPTPVFPSVPEPPVIVPVTPVSETVVPALPPLPTPASGVGKLDFSGFQETPAPAPLPSVVPGLPASGGLDAFPAGSLAASASPSAPAPTVAPSPPMGTGSGTLEQQLAAKRETLDSLVARISRATIALNQAQVAGDSVGMQSREAELAGLRSQVGIVDSEIISLQQQLASVSSVGAPAATPAASAAPRPDLIDSGETIELLVMQDESFNGMYQVRQGGYILIPQVGRVPVAGMTVPAAEDSVAKAFSQTMIVNPTVIIERPEAAKEEEDNGGVIYLMGDFKRPGTFRMQRGRPTTILNTIIQSGGETPGADLSRVRLMRLVNGRNLVEEINVNEILKGGGLANDMMLRDGDILHIPSKPEEATADPATASMRRATPVPEDPAQPTQGRDNGVFVTGRVKSAGFVALTEDVGLTAYTAILAKGGFAPFANIKKVYVVREVGGGQKVHIPVNIRNVQHGLEPDVELRTKDIVVVPEKFFSL